MTGPHLRKSIPVRLRASLCSHFSGDIGIVAVFVALAYVAFWRTGFEGTLYFGDAPFTLSPSNMVASLTQLWSANVPWLSNLPYYLMPAVAQNAGIPVQLSQRISFILIYALVGVSMYLLLRHSFGVGRLASLAGGIIYMYNPLLTSYYLVGGAGVMILVYAMRPLFLVACHRAIRLGTFEAVASAAILSLFFLEGDAWLIVTSLYLTLAFAVYVLFTSHDRWKVLTRFLYLGLATIILNLYWIVPTFANLHSIYASQVSGLTAENVGALFPGNSILDSFRLYQTYQPFGFASFYGSALGLSLTMVIPVFSFLCMVLHPRRRALLALSGCAIFLIWLLSGLYPVGQLYVFLISVLPYSFAYLPTHLYYFLLLLPIPISILFAISTGQVQNILERRRTEVGGRILVIGLVLTILSASWVGLTGNEGGFLTPVDIPSYYDSLVYFFAYNATGDYRILLLPPPNYLTYIKYDWSPTTWWSADFLPQYLGTRAIEAARGARTQDSYLVNLATQELGEGKNASAFLRMLNVRYAVLRMDTVLDFGGPAGPLPPIESYEKGLQSSGFKQVARFGEVKVFENMHATSKVFSSYESSLILEGSPDFRAALNLSSALGLPLVSISASSLESLDSQFSSVISTVYQANPVMQEGGENATTLRSLTDDKQTVFWDVAWNGQGDLGPPSISNDSAIKVSGGSSLKIQIGRGTFERVVLYHTFGNVMNWLNYDYVSFYLNAAETGGFLRLTIFAPDSNNVFYYNLPSNFTGSKQFKVPLLDFSTGGSPKWSQVKNVQFEFYGTGTWYVDHLYLSQSKLVVRNQLYPSWVVPKLAFTDAMTGSSITMLAAATQEYYFGINSNNYSILSELAIDGNLTSRTPLLHLGSYSLAGPFFLKRGFHRFSFDNARSQNLSVVLLPRSSLNTHSNGTPNPISSYQRAGPSDYVVVVNSTRPFLLILSEPPRPHWVIQGTRLYVRGTVDGYGVGYLLANEGPTKVSLYYWPQNVFVASVFISLATLVGFLFLMVVGYAREHIRKTEQKGGFNHNVVSVPRCIRRKIPPPMRTHSRYIFSLTQSCKNARLWLFDVWQDAAKSQSV